jgi:hypothetical protein
VGPLIQRLLILLTEIVQSISETYGLLPVKGFLLGGQRTPAHVHQGSLSLGRILIANGGLSLVHSFDWFSFSLAIELLLHGWRFSTITFPWISSPAVFLAKEDWGVEQCDLVCLHPRVVHRAGIVWLWGILNPSQFDCVFFF